MLTSSRSLVPGSDLRRVAKYSAISKLGLQSTYLLYASRREIPLLGEGGESCLDVISTDQRTVVSGLQILLTLVFRKHGAGNCCRGLMSCVMRFLQLPTRLGAMQQAPLYANLLGALSTKKGESNESRPVVGVKRPREDGGDEENDSGKCDPAGAVTLPASLYPPLFFVDGPFTQAHSLFVAMHSQGTLTDEELNTYFGRYGFIASSKVSFVSPLPPTGSASTAEAGTVSTSGGETGSSEVTGDADDQAASPEGAGQKALNAAIDQLFSSPCLRDVQCFVVVLDSNKQCIRALSELRHTEVLFMAPHDPSRNDLGVVHVAQHLVNTISLTKPGEAQPPTAIQPDMLPSVHQLLSVVGPLVSHRPGSAQFNHVSAGLKVLHKDSAALLAELRNAVDSVLGSSGGGGGGAGGADGSGTRNRLEDPNDPEGVVIGEFFDGENQPNFFVPDVVVDGIPFWSTVDSIRDRVSQYGMVTRVLPSTNDRNGAFLGSAIVKMRTVKDARKLCNGLNGVEFEEGWGPMTVGVVSADFNIEDLETGSILQLAHRSDLGYTGEGQPRMWV